MVKEVNNKKDLQQELKKTKEDLQALELYLNDLISFLPVAFCLLSGVGKIVDVNNFFTNLTGYSLFEANGKLAEEIVVEKQKMRETLKVVREFNKVIKNEEFTLISKKGKEIPVSVSLAPRKDREGDLIGYFLSFVDITEFKKLQQTLEDKVRERTKELEERIKEKKEIEQELKTKLKELENLTKELKDSRAALLNILEDIEEAREVAETERDKTLAIVMNFPEGLMFFDEKNNLVSVNPKTQQLFPGITTFLGKNLIQLNPRFLGGLGTLLVKKEPILKQELSLRSNLVLEVSVIEVKRKDKKIGKLVILRDITREKFIEKLKTEFVSIAAHQLRTPLSAIKWTLRLILDGDVGKISQEQKELLEKTYQSNERMIHLINDLLNVTRIEEGRFIYKPQFSDIINIAEGVVSSLKETASRKGLKFEFKKPSINLPKVKVDEEKIALVFQNLIENAIHYTPSGGKVELEIDYPKQKNEILVKVKDTGIGISKEEQKRVFTRFFRGKNAIRTDTEGTGLGLYIAKNIIESHKGKIWFESQEGKGTTFYFTLPVAS